MKFLVPETKIKFASIFLIWLFHFSGVVGIGFLIKIYLFHLHQLIY